MTDLIEHPRTPATTTVRLMQQWSAVLSRKHSVRILVVQFWTIDLEPIERSLRSAGIDAEITRVDFRSSLDAALAHERFDAVVYDPDTPDLSRDAVEECLRHHDRDTPVVVLEEVGAIGAIVAELLSPRRN